MAQVVSVGWLESERGSQWCVEIVLVWSDLLNINIGDVNGEWTCIMLADFSFVALWAPFGAIKQRWFPGWKPEALGGLPPLMSGTQAVS